MTKKELNEIRNSNNRIYALLTSHKNEISNYESLWFDFNFPELMQQLIHLNSALEEIENNGLEEE